VRFARKGSCKRFISQQAPPKAAHHSSGMNAALPSASEHLADAARAARPPTLPPCTSSPRFVDIGEDVEAQIVEDRACVLGVHVYGKLVAEGWRGLGAARAWGGEGLERRGLGRRGLEVSCNQRKLSATKQQSELHTCDKHPVSDCSIGDPTDGRRDKVSNRRHYR
jgi:hypothetical protein